VRFWSVAKSSTDELKDDLVRGWLIKSGTDLATAVKLAAAPDPYLDTAIYHCQQAAEKALKGLLAYFDQRVVRTHDVGYLVTLAVPFEESLRSCLESAERVTPYATAYRYPDEVLEPEREEFDQALAAAEAICIAVLSVLPKEAHPPRPDSRDDEEKE
jgi:HEPN domain-containing protein